MDFVRLSISRPVTVVVGVILVVMFGLIGFSAVPIQLAPNVDRPEITVTTAWPGRSPQEIVDEIVKDQEEQLKNVSNLESMTSTSREGAGEIKLEFYIGTSITRALQEVSDSLRQVEDYPEDVTEPTIKAADGASENAIAWIIIDLDPAYQDQFPDFDVSTLFRPLDQEVKPYLERIDGVAEVNVYGGREREMQVLVDPVRLAQRGLNHLDLLAALQQENRNISAGSIAEGKRDYRVRVIGQFESEQDILETIVAYREGGPVYVKDIATVKLDYEKQRGFVRSLGHRAIAINAIRQSNANVVEVMQDLRDRLEEVRTEILPKLAGDVGPHLRLRQVYDETTYIDSAISLVTQNLYIGGAIAAFVLLIFLRSFVATGVTAIAIPVSVIGTFLVLLALGRTLNVISLAGLAFAVGMVVDNAIVVLENIYRHRQMGKPPVRAAYDGGREVIGAIVASTLTTVAVFVPVLTVQEEAGQLFRDISLAIVASVSLSLIVSVTVIPAALSRFLKAKKDEKEHGRIRRAFESLFGLAPALQRMNRFLGERVYWVMTGWRGWTLRPALIVLMTVVSLLGAYLLKPPLDYLPAGNRNLVFGGLLIPPGYSQDQMTDVANRIEDQLRPYVGAQTGPGKDMSSLDPIARGQDQEPYRPVGVDNFFIGAFDGGMFVGATSTEEQVVLPVGQLLTNAMVATPDAFGGANQSSLFGRGVGGGNSIDIEILGPDLERVAAAADYLFDSLGRSPQYGYGRVRPTPSNFSVPQQEFRVRVSQQGRELGIRTEGVGTAVRALFDGAFAGDFRTAGQAIDIRLLPEGGRLTNKEQVASIPIATPRGPLVPMDTVVDFEPGLAPQEIRRIEELPAVTVSVTPPDGEPLESVMNDIRENFIQPAREQGLIDRTMRVRLEGTAAQLDEVTTALLGTSLGDEASDEGGRASWQVAADIFGVMLLLAGLGVGVFGLVKCVTKKKPLYAYGSAGALVLATILFSIFFFGIGSYPELLMGRIVWSVIVVYLLMCALFESFVYPFVIMFSVPLALVGGFAGLAIVHWQTANNPYIATQNLDVLTMLGIVILVGVVVNNAILIVHQSLNLMRGTGDVDPDEMPEGYEPGQPMEPMRAIAEAVKTRTRPVFMSTMTSVGGMLPLVLFPGAGSELYRGLGSVVVGGLLVSTVFTLLLVPLVFGLTLQMTDGLRALLGMRSAADAQKRDIGREMLGLKPDASKESLEQQKPEPVGA